MSHAPYQGPGVSSLDSLSSPMSPLPGQGQPPGGKSLESDPIQVQLVRGSHPRSLVFHLVMMNLVLRRVGLCAPWAGRLARPAPRSLVCASSARIGLAYDTTSAAAELDQGLQMLEEGDPASAVEAFKRAAASGSSGGNFYLGLAYDDLLGSNARGEPVVEPSAEAAFRCYCRAADGGHVEAMFNLSFCYRDGSGVARDVVEAFRYLTLAAAGGSERAAFNAGVALDPLHPPWGGRGEGGAGDFVPKDAARAVDYYHEAVELGHPKAKVNLGVALYTGTGCEQDKTAAAALWRDAHDEGVAEASFCLRNMETSPGKLENYFRGDEL